MHVSIIQKSSFSLPVINNLKKSISTLIFSSRIDHVIKNSEKICYILDHFSIGTQKSKKVIKGAPDQSLLGPIFNLPN